MDDGNLRQSHALMAALAQNVDWNSINPVEAQELIRNPHLAGRLFRKFVNCGIGPTYEWHEEGEMISFNLISDGTTGEQWAKECGHDLNPCVEDFFRSPEFGPSTGMIYKVRVLKKKPGNYAKDVGRVGIEASQRRLLKPGNAELACLIWRKFHGREFALMDLSDIIIMHEPVMVAGSHCLLAVSSYEHNYGCGIVGLSPDALKHEYSGGLGFAYVARSKQHL